MITIVVVEDEQKYQDIVKEIIKKISIQEDQDINMIFFNNYTAKLEKEIHDTDTRKIYILDIDLKQSTSGVTIAEKIREIDWNCEIIFITNHDKMFETVYRSVYNVFAFIEKFHNFESKLEFNIKKIIKHGFDNKMFNYKTKNIEIDIYFKNILYIHCLKEERKLCIETENNNFLINISLQEIMNYLDDRFKIVHRSCIANTQRVEEYNWNKGYFVLDTGVNVPYLSKKYRKDVGK